MRSGCKQRIAASRVFVSLSSSFPMGFVGVILRTSKNMGLDSRVFRGIPQYPHPQISNIEYEARGDMFSSNCVFAALAIAKDGPADGTWIIKYLPQLKARGIRVEVGLVGVNVAGECTAGECIRCVPNPLIGSDSSGKSFTSAEEWLAYLVKELHGLAE